MTTSSSEPSYRSILGLAWPMILANAAVPTLGLVDTAVIGRGGAVEGLGAIALGALVFSFLYWSFGFLRMGTTGFVAQADGAEDEAEVRAAFARAGVLAIGLGVVIVSLQRPIGSIALRLIEAGADVENLTRVYFDVRVWGAPATLVSFAVMGALIGLGQTRMLLFIQLFLNGLNIVLDLLFAAVLGWGVRGVALGTVLSEWLASLLGLFLVVRLLRRRHADPDPFVPWRRMRNLSLLLGTFRAHRDILIRTLLLLSGFAFFTQQGAKFGDEVLAANHVLLQFVSFAAFFLDGIAFAVESLVGKAAGARDVSRFDRAVRRSSHLAFGLAVALAGGLFLTGPALIRALTDLEPVRGVANELLLLPVIYIVVAVWAFQLDGVFIGVTRTREMRNASIVSLALFLVAARPLIASHGNTGLWLAFIGYAAARALSLLVYMPRIRRGVLASV